jgi:hypothetical protein
MDEYLNKAQTIEFPGEEKAETINKLKNIVEGIKRTIVEYYMGHPFKAYEMLDKTINQNQLYSHWVENNVGYKDFYRIRVNDSKYPLERKDLFHIPFQKRGRVKTQRYSIPGFPSLYLSNSIYVAWEELKRPKLEEIQAARFRNKYTLILVDLTTDKYSKRYKTEVLSDQISQLLLWPLVFICSIKTKFPEDSFKPEFIVPQLLLQWLRKNSDIVTGIKFSSTHIDFEKTKSTGLFFNVVIPVFENKESGFCKYLSEAFNMTEVLSWQLYQFSMGGPGVSIKYQNPQGISNHEVMELELIENNELDYKYSPFATLELALQMMKLKEIKFIE